MNGTLERSEAPKIGNAAFAAFLKNWRRDSSSSLFSSFIGFDIEPYSYLLSQAIIKKA